jgi:hypothetical protein
MSDALYLSLWYPNLRLEALPDKLLAVLTEFQKHGGEPLVYSATVWPVDWSESPIFQQVYGRRTGAAEPGTQPGADPRLAVEEATEIIHDDYAYEFQIGWNLWQLESPGEAVSSSAEQTPDDNIGATLDPRWVRATRLVRVTGFGPLFDEGAYEQDGHVRIDFGNDAPFLEEEAELNSIAARLMEENVRQLVGLTTGLERASGATARLLWSELGESLAQRLAARLGQGN